MSCGDEVVVALDWTPNTNHTGFFVAKAQGLYAAAGLKVRLLGCHEPDFRGSYSEDNGTNPDGAFPTPCSKVAAKTATFGLNSPEGVVGWNTPPPGVKRPALKAVAAILQDRTSAIVTLKSSGLDSPKCLDGKIYASYAARFEGRIVQSMIRNDGGTGEFQEKVLPMLGIWNTLLEGKADATWVFMNWEGVEARMKGVDLNAFYLQDFGIPYAYAPCMLAHPDTLTEEPDMVKKFLNATAQGFEWAAAHPVEAADILVAGAKETGFDLDAEMVRISQQDISSAYLDENGKWGRMKADRWDAYLDWLSDSGLLTTFQQSRSPKPGVSASLDELRAGNAGERIPRESLDSTKLFTSEFFQ
uniref:Thiamine pyrimidine synthase n=1 Tax=Pyramimonas parkeae TaxID=36894 RepID=A0A0A7ACB7_9CHLO|nr:Thi5-like protein [Pyramimonas parkeae]|mmetsp:Transcript_18795/g.35808  ORF Transcript_18795/g.35808 Transcript_18795/m.35808 type:complete len:358 (-) Transcript_18795:302-1375(-)|eukprot:CAMPEP_0114237968 /NCGR_PEP_ID=MMETSP0058-20121206/7677_1 /TAXON_ID=36894 /ORGANISM="Pyramimonas parkeae, CCMP726" /LENGTH=357 /DNA_ID=CAMNT_0001350053 /DNA_START=126 /DNA_END=1199 /DNA_ORIENTATION=+